MHEAGSMDHTVVYRFFLDDSDEESIFFSLLVISNSTIEILQTHFNKEKVYFADFLCTSSSCCYLVFMHRKIYTFVFHRSSLRN